MFGLDGLATDRAVGLARVLRLVDGGVDGTKTFQALLEFGGQTFVGFDLGEEEGVSSTVLGLLEDPEEGCARGLRLVGLHRDTMSDEVLTAALNDTHHIRVPASLVGAVVEAAVFAETLVVGVAVNYRWRMRWDTKYK